MAARLAVMRTPKRILERRRWVRIEEALPFRIGHAAYETETVTINISAHGALCLVEKDIPVMTKLDLVLSLPPLSGFYSKTRAIRLRGVVVRKEEDPAGAGFRLAVYFSGVRPDDQRLLQEFIRLRSKR